ncbi:acyltransferase [Neobacillus sp. NPDC097160]|uniref:acyltransferase n=1 Tax=Neobacillus sp. NPDC097160 TaxID=3364298 RepID=UPI00380EBD8D
MKRLVYLDWLRVLATIAVVTIHVTAGSVSKIQPGQHISWLEANLFETLSRWSVPGFVMISGALLLQDQRMLTLTEFLKKRASKVVIPFIVWSIFFYIYGAYIGYFPASIKSGIKLFITNGISYHLWFLYMIVGIYLITPLLQIFVRQASKQHIQYFLLLWLYASVATRLSDFLIGVRFSIELFFVTDYVGYFLLGYFLSHFEVPKRWRVISYIGACLGFIGTFWGTYYYTLKGNGILNENWYSYFSPTVLLFTIGIFVWFRYHFQESVQPLPLLLRGINQASLGIYIFHFWLMNNFLWKVYPQVGAHFHPIIALPINLLITVILSTVLTLILKKIPLVKKLVP